MCQIGTRRIKCKQWKRKQKIIFDKQRVLKQRKKNILDNFCSRHGNRIALDFVVVRHSNGSPKINSVCSPFYPFFKCRAIEIGWLLYSFVADVAMVFRGGNRMDIGLSARFAYFEYVAQCFDANMLRETVLNYASPRGLCSSGCRWLSLIRCTRLVREGKWHEFDLIRFFDSQIVVFSCFERLTGSISSERMALAAYLLGNYG